MFKNLKKKAEGAVVSPTENAPVVLREEIIKGNGYEKRELLLQATKINLSFGETVVIKDLDITIRNVVRPDIHQGQVVGFLGPSGIGKTMFFEILAGVRKPTSGDIQIYDPNKPEVPLHPVKVGQVGVVQQKYPLFQHRTVYGNLSVAAEKVYKDKKERHERIIDVMQRFKLDKHLQQYPDSLSGGQKQRVAIAQQLLCSDNFLLLDEPFSGLDIKMIDQVSELIQQITSMNEYMTVIVVSHDIASTANIADTLWIMGRDYDENHNPIPGSRIKHTYDLVEMGFAWRNDLHDLPAFSELIRDVRHKFDEL